MGPICCECQVNFRAEQNGIYVVEMADFGPYKLWMADLYKCPGCNKEVISGFGINCIKEHHQPGFSELIDNLKLEGEQIKYFFNKPTQKEII